MAGDGRRKRARRGDAGQYWDIEAVGYRLVAALLRPIRDDADPPVVRTGPDGRNGRYRRSRALRWRRGA